MMKLKIISLLLINFSANCIGSGPLYNELFENKKILITGGTGFIGKALVTEILKYNPTQIIIFSRDEVKHYKMLHDFDDPRLKSVLGDVRDYASILTATKGVDVVIHAAALKRIDILEYNIGESIATNIIGTEHIAKACIENKVKKSLFVSTDKACLPANAYGACKYISEKIFTNFAANIEHETQFIVVRYGNVLESTGSVIPFFCQKIKNHEPIPLTDDRMTRFFIAKEQAIELIFKALLFGTGGEIFIPSLPAFKITDLITVLQEQSGLVTDIKIVGLRPGEKIHELMINSTEVSRTYKFKDMYVITPTIKLKDFDSKYKSNGTLLSEKHFTEYSSETSILEKKALHELLNTFQISYSDQ